MDSCYSPVVQSGGEYDLRPGVQVNDEPLHFGTIVCALGARFKSYCTNIGRTYFVDPVKEQEQNYKLLLEVQQLVIAALVPGAKLGQIYDKACKYVEDKKPELLEKFSKTCGFAVFIRKTNFKDGFGIPRSGVFN